MIRRLHLAILVAGLAPLAACSTPLDQPISPALGAAVASMNAQIIPAAVSNEPPPGSGAQAVAAVTRYETGKVKQPPAPGTSQISSEMGSSQGGVSQ